MSKQSPKDSYVIHPIGRVESPYAEKFGTPRQPGLVKAALGKLCLSPDYAKAEPLEGLEGFSHLWVIFVFDRCDGQAKLSVRPPRLGGNANIGVFASRSPFRPNNLGLSVLKIESIDKQHGEISVSGLDLVNDTPIIDIKPYVPYVDAVSDAASGFAEGAPTKIAVVFDENAHQQLQQLPDGDALKPLIEQTLGFDPRPAYKKEKADDQVYGTALGAWNVRWQVEQEHIRVLTLEPYSVI